MIAFIARLFSRSEPSLSEASPRDAARFAALHSASFRRGWSEGEFERLLIDRNITAHRAAIGTDLAGFILSRRAADEAEILSVAVCFIVARPRAGDAPPRSAPAPPRRPWRPRRVPRSRRRQRAGAQPLCWRSLPSDIAARSILSAIDGRRFHGARSCGASSTDRGAHGRWLARAIWYSARSLHGVVEFRSGEIERPADRDRSQVRLSADRSPPWNSTRCHSAMTTPNRDAARPRAPACHGHPHGDAHSAAVDFGGSRAGRYSGCSRSSPPSRCAALGISTATHRIESRGHSFFPRNPLRGARARGTGREDGMSEAPECRETRGGPERPGSTSTRPA